MSKEHDFNPVVKTIDNHKIVYPILFMISLSHLLNDLLQSIIPSLYPILKDEFQLSFAQIGIITFVFQMTASIFQPFVGVYTDKKPNPKFLISGITLSMTGLLLLAFAHYYPILLFAVALIGMGSSVFHPEASRVAQLASGGQKGLAQSIFQVGGNSGSAIGPLLVALVVLPLGQSYVGIFAVPAFIGLIVLWKIAKWYARQLSIGRTSKKTGFAPDVLLSRKRVLISIITLLVLVFSKYIYLASMNNYLTFFLMEKFHISVKNSQLCLFTFAAAVAVGTISGGRLGDKYGRKNIIWISILGAAPFTLCLPYLSFGWTIVFIVLIGLIVSVP